MIIENLKYSSSIKYIIINLLERDTFIKPENIIKYLNQDTLILLEKMIIKLLKHESKFKNDYVVKLENMLEELKKYKNYKATDTGQSVYIQ